VSYFTRPRTTVRRVGKGVEGGRRACKKMPAGFDGTIGMNLNTSSTDARSGIVFSTSSAIALSGLLCDRAMMVIAFQSSPILSLPRAWRRFSTLLSRFTWVNAYAPSAMMGGLSIPGKAQRRSKTRCTSPQGRAIAYDQAANLVSLSRRGRVAARSQVYAGCVNLPALAAGWGIMANEIARGLRKRMTPHELKL
jgi:hypothetical protein